MQKLEKLFYWLLRNNALDKRSLALFRILVSLVILVDLFLRWGDIQSFYTDQGVLPRSFFAKLIPIFPHFWAGTLEFQSFLIVLQMIFAVLMLLGYRTRISTIISWFLMVSLINRNPYVIHTGDILLRTALFWGMFLPLGANFSLDKLLGRFGRQIHIYNIYSCATLAFSIQLMAAYFFPGIVKVFTPQWISGNAMYYALSSDQWSTPFGQSLTQLPLFFLSIMTYATIIFEVVAPLIFVFSPSKKAKLIVVLLFILLHTGFLFNLTISTFPLMSIAILTALLPTLFWENLQKLFKDKKKLKYETEGDKLPKVINFLIITSLVLILIANLSSFFYTRPTRNKELIGSFFNQNIKMFAPPPLVDMWVVIPGKLANGNLVDVYKNGGTLSFEKPEILSGFTRRGHYPNQRWAGFLGKISHSNPEILPYYANYLCNQWNRTHVQEERLLNLKIVYMLDRIMLEKKPDVRDRVTKLIHTCN